MRTIGSRSLGRLAVLLGLTLLLGLAPAAAASAGVSTSQWHRLNPANENPPEHERLTCVFGSVDRCRYDKIPESDLDFEWNRTRGVFVGAESTATWTCPDWFPEEICTNADRVSTGTGVFFPEGEDPFSVGQDLIVMNGTGDTADLYVYWHDQFVCPWFTTFDAALDANPIPLPYDGVNGGGFDCTVLPG